MKVKPIRVFVWFYLIVGAVTGLVSDLDFSPNEQDSMNRTYIMGVLWPMYWPLRIVFFDVESRP